jgi:hypothetical protein
MSVGDPGNRSGGIDTTTADAQAVSSPIRKESMMPVKIKSAFNARKSMGEQRKGMGEQRVDKNKESRNGDLRTTKRSRARNKAHKSKRNQRKNKVAYDRDHSSTIDVVLMYAAAGWPVFPLHSNRMNGSCSCNDPHCEQPGKHARVTTATTNPGKIKKYWNRWPHAKIGMPMGKGSSFLALVSEGSAGEKALRELEETKGSLTAVRSRE